MKGLIRLISVILVILLFSLTLIDESEARLSSNNRRAVVLETFYSLRPTYDGGCDKTINGNCVSNWNYLYNDVNAYTVVKGWYGSNSSVWSLFYSDIASYGYSTSGGSYGPVGRGGQCKYFVQI